MDSRPQKIRRCSLLLLAYCMSGFAHGQDYPSKPVRLILPGPAAGGADVIMRPVAQRLNEQMGQQVVVDNRPGAGGTLAGQLVMTLPADGYSLLVSTAGGFSVAPFVSRQQPYHPERDFAPITMVATAPMMIAVHPALPVRAVRDLVVLAKSTQHQLFYASNGQASFSHLTAEYFSQVAGVRMTHVPYKGGTPAVIDTVSGQVHLIMTALPTLMAQVKSLRLRAIAVTSAKRTAVVPDLPTVAESGYPHFEVLQWYGVVAPKGTPPRIIERLYNEFRRAGESAVLKGPLAQEGAELMVTGPQALADFLRADIAKWRRVIRDSNIVLE